jgi:hypothetical protein
VFDEVALNHAIAGLTEFQQPDLRLGRAQLLICERRSHGQLSGGTGRSMFVAGKEDSNDGRGWESSTKTTGAVPPGVSKSILH